MIFNESIGASYMWNKNTRSMIGMFQMIIKHHQKHNIGQIGYEGLGIVKIDDGKLKRAKK
jgi:long-subunit fatty acid transport protein